MAYGERGQNFALLKRAITGAFDFSGRSRRMEVVIYWLATMLLTAVMDFVISSTLEWKESILARLTLDLLISLPMFALFTRRLHDQNRSGWCALLLPLPLAVNTVRSIRLATLSTDAYASTPDPISGLITWITVLIVLGFLGLLIIPGTPGENRFGPDPRLAA